MLINKIPATLWLAVLAAGGLPGCGFHFGCGTEDPNCKPGALCCTKKAATTTPNAGANAGEVAVLAAQDCTSPGAQVNLTSPAFQERTFLPGTAHTPVIAGSIASNQPFDIVFNECNSGANTSTIKPMTVTLQGTSQGNAGFTRTGTFNIPVLTACQCHTDTIEFPTGYQTSGIGSQFDSFKITTNLSNLATGGFNVGP